MAKRRQLSLIKSVCGHSSSEEQRNQQLKMVVTIAQDEGVEFQHSVFYL